MTKTLNNPPPPTQEQRLRKALTELDALDCEYELNFKGTLYTRIKRKANAAV